jgi:hypothetical protein
VCFLLENFSNLVCEGAYPRVEYLL